ncbi:MAG: peptidase T [Thermoleophilia bacterium]
MPAPYTSPLAEALAPGLLERFVRYARIATQSDPESETTPSSERQLDLGRLLEAELRAIGLDDAEIDDAGYVFATLPATVPDTPVVGLIAHVDTSPDAPGDGVEPLVHRDYDGGVIALPRGGTVLDPQRMPELRGRAGHDIVTSSGDTLLGADDKAGIAAIMAAVEYLAAHPELPRPALRVGFTVDEEVGRGALSFDVARFGARCAYTIDGSTLGELQDESFNGSEARVVVHGVEVHPGFAKGKMVNALKLAAAIVAALPADRLSPETTDGREGYVHPHELRGDVTRAEIRFILRDFDEDGLAAHEALVREVAERVVGAEPRARLEIAVRAQYPNMRAHLACDPEVMAAAERAIRAEGVEPLRVPIRGGTDGSLLSAMGLPTPNIFDGGHEYHSVREWASLQDMAAAAAVIVRLAAEWSAGSGPGG